MIFVKSVSWVYSKSLGKAGVAFCNVRIGGQFAKMGRVFAVLFDEQLGAVFGGLKERVAVGRWIK